MQNNNSPVEDPHAGFERMLIDQFLGFRGYTRPLSSQLPAPEAATLLRAASEYASLRLAEIECKAHYVHEIRRWS